MADAYTEAFSPDPSIKRDSLRRMGTRLIDTARVQTELARLNAVRWVKEKGRQHQPLPDEALPLPVSTEGAIAPPPLGPSAKIRPLEMLPTVPGCTKYGKGWLLALLETNIARAMQLVPAKVDEEGNVTEFKYDGGVVNKAVELIAKLEGLMVEKREVSIKSLDNITPEELQARRREIQRQLARERGQEIEEATYTEGGDPIESGEAQP